MTKRYFEVEVEYTGTKIFHIQLNDMMDERDALKYIADHFRNLERDGNAVADTVSTNLLSINYREDRR